MSDLTVSVIITAYNAERWIGQVLESVLAQTYPSKLVEIIVVDDGSGDATPEIVQQLAASHSRICLIRQPNQGTAGAVTTGLRAACGDILFLLSHDCYAAPDWLVRVVQVFEHDPLVGIVQGPILPARPIDVPIYHCTTLRQPSRSFEGAAIAYRGTSVDRVGRYFDPLLSRCGDDADMAWRILESGYIFQWLDEPTAYHEVVPRPFWKAIKAARDAQMFPLLIKRHHGMRRLLRGGILWGGRYRYLRMIGLHGAFIALSACWIPLMVGLVMLVFAVSWYESFRLGHARSLSIYDKLVVIPLHKLLGEFVGTHALLLGSFRYRCVLL